MPKALVDQNATGKIPQDSFGLSYVQDQLELLRGEPLNDTVDTNAVRTSLIEPNLLRWLRAAAICNTDSSSTDPTDTVKADIKAVAAMRPGQHFHRAMAQTDRIQQKVKSGVSEQAMNAHQQRKALVEEERTEAITGIGKQKKAKVLSLEELSPNGQRIAKLPLDTVCPLEPFSPDVYDYTPDSKGKTHLKLHRMNPGDVGWQRTGKSKNSGKKSKAQAGTRVEKKKKTSRLKHELKHCTLPTPEDASLLPLLANAYYRCATYLLTKEEYTWEDDKVRARQVILQRRRNIHVSYILTGMESNRLTHRLVGPIDVSTHENCTSCRARSGWTVRFLEIRP